jgi:hypothetical protein
MIAWISACFLSVNSKALNTDYSHKSKIEHTRGKERESGPMYPYLQITQTIQHKHFPIPPRPNLPFLLAVLHTQLDNRIHHDIQHLIEPRIYLILVLVAQQRRLIYLHDFAQYLGMVEHRERWCERGVIVCLGEM